MPRARPHPTVRLSEMSADQRDELYRSEFNWAADDGSPLAEADRENLARHAVLVGRPIGPDGRRTDGTAFDAFQTAMRLREHFHLVRQAAEGEFVGDRVIDVLRGMYLALVFGQNCYVEGSSGTAKTRMMQFLAGAMRVPLAEFNASADATDLSLLGGEIPSGLNTFRYSRGPAVKPGAMVLMIDELPRLPVQTSNVLLYGMATKQTVVSLVATGWGDHTVALSPNFSVMGVGNPAGYGGQSAERSQALWDRFGVGLFMPQPSSSWRFQMYRRALAEPVRDLMSPESATKDEARREIPPGYTFRDAHAALAKVEVSDDLLRGLCAASFAVAPRAFRERCGWPKCEFYDQLTDRARLGREERASLARLTDLVETHLAEGSNPRGELAVLPSARGLALIDDEAIGTGRTLAVTARHLADAFQYANRNRLKTLPGDEERVEDVLAAAVATFFPAETARPGRG